MNLVELDKEIVKDDDRVALLEGGLPRSSSRGNLSARANLIRLVIDSMGYKLDEPSICSMTQLMLALDIF